MARYYSWSTVKLYYCAFYSLRALLAINGIAISYDVGKPRLLRAQAGATLQPAPGRTKRETSTHGVVVESFKRMFPTHPLLSQLISLESPPDWLRHKREETNYSTPRFREPQAPDHFAAVARYSVRKLMNTYISDSRHTYTFDPDHAMMCLPIKFMQDLKAEFSQRSLPRLPEEDREYLSRLLVDDAGAIPLMDHMII